MEGKRGPLERQRTEMGMEKRMMRHDFYRPLSGVVEPEEGIIRPLRVSADPDVGADALMAIVSKDLDYLVRLHGAGQAAHSSRALFRLYQIKAGRAEVGASLCGPFFGAPLAVMGMEKMIALGAKRIWVLGCCGSLQPDLRIGDVVIPESSLSEEGTSQHYPVGNRVPATDRSLNQILEEAFLERGEQVRRGRVWTTDAPYRETPAKVQAFQKIGILAVEMEMSALITVGTYRGVKVSGVLVVSDELFDLRWQPGFSSDRFKRKSRLAAEVLVHAMTSFARESSPQRPRSK